MKSLATLLLLALTFITACKKDDDEAAAPTNKELLTAKVWKAKYFTLNGAASDPFCQKNFLYSYHNDGKLIVVEGDNEGACSGFVPGKNETWDWYFIDGETKFVRINPDDPTYLDTVEILNVSATELRTKQIKNVGTSTWVTTLFPL